MKYILKKKWHPSQVEEVGYVYEENEGCEIFYRVHDDEDLKYIRPHEIALLCEAGYLEKQKCSCANLKNGDIIVYDEKGECVVCGRHTVARLDLDFVF